MKLSSIESEFLACRAAFGPRHADALAAAGVPSQIWSVWGLTGAARISTSRGLFQLDPGGFGAVIVAVRWPDPFIGPHHLDLVAFRLSERSKWWLRRGHAVALGTVPDDLWPGDPPVRFHRSPLAWLRAGGEGVVLIGGSRRDQQAIVQRCHAVEADDHRHARELARIASTAWPTPRITVAAAADQRGVAA